MSVRLRLKRIGMPKQPHYRLVAINRQAARNGKEVEVLGYYDPRKSNDQFSFNTERITFWLSCGAQPSDTVRSLLSRAGFFSAPKNPSPSPIPGQEQSPST